MLNKEDLAGLRGDIQVLQHNVGAKEFSMSIEYLNNLLDTLEKSLLVVEVSQKVSAYAYRHGDNHSTILELNEALAPFTAKTGEAT